MSEETQDMKKPEAEKQPEPSESSEAAPKEQEQKPAEQKEASSEKKEEKKPAPDPKAEEIAALKKQNAELQGQVDKLKNAYARAYADTENTRRRLTNEFDQHMKYHIADFAKEILPCIDNCERALAVKAADTNDENYRKAFEKVLKSLTAALKKEGVEEIEADGKEYDPNLMQAMMTEHVEGVKPGMVTQVLQKGYKLKDRLLRAAMVKVSE